MGRLASGLKARAAEAEAEAAAIRRVREHLQGGRPARTLLEGAELTALIQSPLLTAKPEVYLANIGEGQDPAEVEGLVRRLEGKLDGPVVAVAGKLEADLAELEEEERAAFMAEMDLSSTGLERVIRACYDRLGLITFFTGVGAEARAWAVPRGTTAAAAAGRIHTDMGRGFVRAEVIGFEELAAAGSWQAAHRAGRVRTEGRDYELREGEVILIRFQP